MEVRIRSGSVTLDFTQAQVTWPTLQIDADVHSGSLTLLTKPGIVLDTDDVAVRSGTVRVKAPWGPGGCRPQLPHRRVRKGGQRQRHREAAPATAAVVLGLARAPPAAPGALGASARPVTQQATRPGPEPLTR